MKRFMVAGLCAAGAFATVPGAIASEAETCRTVRLAEPGWNDLAFTTGVAGVLLDALGYEARSDLLGLEVIYQSLKNGDLDVFLGYWDPAMETYYQPYREDGSVETVKVNLEGAKYTFAVPRYAWEAGVRDFSDLQGFADEFSRTLYGIEPGSNQLMLDVIADPAFGLDDWEVIESSEAGMLSEVRRRTNREEFIVFQGWAPHPMNAMFDFEYLTGGDAHYGPDFGAATVSTQVRAGYMAECPNVARLLENLTFDIAFENVGMGYLINDGMSPEDAARKAIGEEPQRLEAWLDGVDAIGGGSGLEAARSRLGL